MQMSYYLNIKLAFRKFKNNYIHINLESCNFINPVNCCTNETKLNKKINTIMKNKIFCYNYYH